MLMKRMAMFYADFYTFHSALLPDPQKKDVHEIARKSQSRAAVIF